MRVTIVTPAPPGSRQGNRVAALRWARILRGLGHRVRVATSFAGAEIDVLIAVHARKSAAAVSTFRAVRPRGGLIVVLAGTDAYVDLPRKNRSALASVASADRLIALQPLAALRVPARFRRKVRVVFQSAEATRRPRDREDRGATSRFVVAVVGHLRPIKDPFRAPLAALRLPPHSRVEIVHAGRALTRSTARRARDEMRRNPRYRWVGEVGPGRVRALLARADAFVISSLAEGGANALGEAIVARVPVLASRIPGSVGLLGRDYPGYFEPGDTAGLARLLLRAETDPPFRRRLERAVTGRSHLFAPSREREAWRALLREMRTA